MTRLDPALLEQIKARVSISEVAALYVTADKRKSKPGDLWACCCFHKEKSPSFHAEDARGRAHCYGCGVDVDHFELVERMDRVSFRDAVAKVASMAGIQIEGGGEVRDLPPRPVREPAPDPYAGYTFTPAPHDAPPILPGKKTPPLRNPKKQREDGSPWVTHYTPEDVYPYYNSDGELIGYDLRVIIKGEKLTPTILWAQWEDGEGWCHGRLPKMPLLGLPELLANPTRQVLVVEGGKCQKAAAAALEGRVVVVTWCGGTNALDKTDWTPLEGRSIILWPDHDEGGYIAMGGGYVGKPGLKEWRDGVTQLAKPGKVKWVRSYDKEKGADVADLIADGLSVPDYIKANISEKPLAWAGGLVTEIKEKGDDGGNGSLGPVADSYIPPSSATGSDAARVKSADARQPDIGGSEQNPRGQDQGGIGAGDGVREDTHRTPPTITDYEEDDPPTAENWQESLVYNADGTGMKSGSIMNAMLFAEFYPKLKGVFAYNEFNHKIYMMRRPPWKGRTGSWEPTVIDDDDATALRGFLEGVGIGVKKDDTFAVISRVAKHNRFNPVKDTLTSLQWDGIERLSKPYCWLARYMGAAPTDINRAFGRKFMIGGIARIMKPGVKLDTVMVIEGDQGSRKSSALRALCSPFGDKYFLDNLSDPYGKDGKMLLQGKLIVELAELEAFSKSEVRQEKSFITTQVDEFRPPFGRSVMEYPRTFIIAGSTNQEEYLKDPTGARRFWPVRTGEIDLALLQEDAAQLWAEAYVAYQAGEQWWLTAEEEVLAQAEQAKRYKTDPWVGLIKTATLGDMVTDVNRVLSSLEVSKRDRTVYTNERVGNILRQLGFEKDADGYSYKRGS